MKTAKKVKEEKVLEVKLFFTKSDYKELSNYLQYNNLKNLEENNELRKKLSSVANRIDNQINFSKNSFLTSIEKAMSRKIK